MIDCGSCSICLDDIEHENAGQCGHIFHDSCIRSWIKHKTNCPRCQKTVFSFEIQKLYFDVAEIDHKRTVKILRQTAEIIEKSEKE
uniref:RING-type domain-containing protein n=1 Tax=Panagrolaimus sp. JU765 TaxID=591449 RepID=A0AC34RSS7_9BILA